MRGRLEPGEHVLATARAAVATSPVSLLGGAVVAAALAADERSKLRSLGFPAATQMVLGLTGRRLLVFKRRFLSRRPGRLTGYLPVARLTDMSLERRNLQRHLWITLDGGTTIKLVTYKADRPERMTEAFRRVRAEAPVAQRAYDPVVPPPPSF